MDTRESVILKIEKKLNDAAKLALDHKNLIGNTLLHDSIVSLKKRWCTRGVVAKRVVKSGKSRAIAFKLDDFNAKKKERDVRPAEDEWKDKTLEHVKIIAKEMGLGLRGKSRDELIKEIEWERAEIKTRAKEKKVIATGEEE